MLLVASNHAFATPDAEGVRAQLSALGQGAKNKVLIVSRSPAPSWMSRYPALYFQQCPNRQSGAFFSELFDLGWKRGEVAVLGASEEDFRMAVNGRVPLLRAGWARPCEKLETYGTHVSLQELPWVADRLRLKHPWYFRGTSSAYNLYILTNANYRYREEQERESARRLEAYLKGHKNTVRRGFFFHLIAAVLSEPELVEAPTWAYFPSSKADVGDASPIAQVLHKVRTTIKRTWARYDEPMLVRHRDTLARHLHKGADRGPGPQLDTLRLDPAYRKAIRGNAVVVFDDFVNHGSSFNVASALLRKAGAAKVHCVGMGLFGRPPDRETLEVEDDPFKTRNPREFTATGIAAWRGTLSDDAATEFAYKFMDALD